MPSYIPKEFLPKRHAEFPDGKCFAFSARNFPLPCIVKVSSSSAGDGIRICFTDDDFRKAQDDFQNIGGTIVVDEFIHAVKNIGIQFGISSNPLEPIELIGWHEQLTNTEGVFLGGVIDYSDPWKADFVGTTLWPILAEKILPKVRERGWYGIGGFDVLVDKSGKFYFVDPNFRMTGMTEHHCLVRNGFIHSPIISFRGTFEGTEKQFIEAILPIAHPHNPRQLMTLTALTVRDQLYRFTAGMFFDMKIIKMNASILLSKGIRSPVLELIVENK